MPRLAPVNNMYFVSILTLPTCKDCYQSLQAACLRFKRADFLFHQYRGDAKQNRGNDEDERG